MGSDLKIKNFQPYLPIWTGHSQTLLGHIVSSEQFRADFENEILTLPDGDEMLIGWSEGTEPFTLSLYHGLGGNAQSDYIRRSANIARELSWNIVIVNQRGAADKARSTRSYHSGRGEDAEAVIEWSRKKFPSTKQIALGFSMSGSILLNLLSQRYGTKTPDFGIVVNAPLNLERSAWLLTKGFSKVYDVRFYLLLKKIIQSKESMKLPWLARTLDLDDWYTAKVNGFKSREDYYARCSVGGYVQQIKTPLYVLASEDDPVVDIEDYRRAKWPTVVNLTINKHGGHMGYFSKDVDPKYGRRWLDVYLRSVFEEIQITSAAETSKSPP